MKPLECGACYAGGSLAGLCPQHELEYELDMAEALSDPCVTIASTQELFAAFEVYRKEGSVCDEQGS